MERPRDAQSTGHDRQPLSASSVDGSGPKSNNRTKAGLRVSVACVQCRSKHVKCDATLPCCLRCKAEDKPCFYAKSRRGIRDPKKRSLISDKPPATSSSGPFLQLSELPSITIPSQPLRGMLSWNLNLNPDPMPMPSITRDDLLLDAYYKYFQPNHPWLPPKRVFVQHVKSDPHSMDFLLAVMRFVGSLYLPHVLSDDLRDGAYASACGTLPMTPQTVQGLLILGVVAFGESKLEYHAGWTNRAVSTALDIGMQRKDFAEAASDPVIAESYRRTYWGLYFQDTLRRTRQRERGTPLCEIACSVDLPCEEWEFESGQIPDPMSLAEYDLQNNLGETEFSSFSLLVDMCRITGTLVLPCCYDSEEKRGDLFDRADSRICDWLIKVPKWKTELVNAEGVADILLHSAIGFAHVNRMSMRQVGLRHNLNLRQGFSLGPASGPHRQAQNVKGFGWNATPVEIQAANSLCDMFRLLIPIKNLSPVTSRGLLRPALAYLDACVFLGLDTPAIREKLNMIVHILTVHGEIWPISRKVADEVREIIKEYIPASSSSHQEIEVSRRSPWALASGADVDVIPNAWLLPDFDLTLYPEFDHLDQWTIQGNENHHINV